MWIFTKYGFYSISAKGKKQVMVRTRDKQHLMNLQNRFVTIAKLSIIEYKASDYQYRLIMPKHTWAFILSAIAEEQTWSNFKHEAEKFEKQNKMSRGYVDALHDIWFRMRQSVRPNSFQEDIDSALDKLEGMNLTGPGRSIYADKV